MSHNIWASSDNEKAIVLKKHHTNAYTHLPLDDNANANAVTTYLDSK